MTTTQPCDVDRSRSGAHAQFRRLLPELRCAIFLWGIGDRTDEVLQAIAYGKLVYDAIGRTLPSPPETNRQEWEEAVEQIVDRFGHAVLLAAASAA